MKFKNYLSMMVLSLMLLTLTACGGGEPVEYDAPTSAPYKGLYEVDRMNSSSSYSYDGKNNTFKVTMSWVTKDDNIDHAEFSDEYYLEYSMEEDMFFDIYEPDRDMSDIKNKTYTIKPGEEVAINVDIDSYYDDIPSGYYHCVKILEVFYKDGTSKQEVVSFSFSC